MLTLGTPRGAVHDSQLRRIGDALRELTALVTSTLDLSLSRVLASA